MRRPWRPPSLQAAVTRAGGLPVLVSVLRWHERSADVLAAAAGAIYSSVYGCAPNAATITADGAVSLLLTSIANCPDREDVVLNSCAVLKQLLSLGTPLAAQAALAEAPGGATALCDALRRHAESEAVLEYVCGVLKKAAAHPACRAALVAAGAPALLKAVAAKHKGTIAAENATKAASRIRR